MKIKCLQILGAALMLMFCAGLAHADSFTMTLDHCSGTGGCLQGGSYSGTVSVTQGGNSSTVNITVTLSPSGSIAFQQESVASNCNGICGSFAFNLDLASPTIAINGLPSGWGNATNGMMDGAGTYEYLVDCNTACTTGQLTNPNSVTFSVVRTGGTLSPSDFETDGTGANDFFAADVVGKMPTGGVNTGVISGSGPTTTTPEPASLLLFGSGLLGLAGIVRRHFTNLDTNEG